MSGKGYTTGTYASASAKGAVIVLFSGALPKEVEVSLPGGERVEIPLSGGCASDGKGLASALKGWSDDPDITRGMEIVVEAREAEAGEILLKGGEGVGRVTKPGLRAEEGEPAINPVPREMIARACREVLPEGKGVEVTISIPGGEELAKKTLNPKLGIVGGLSILGTSGIIQPWSDRAYRESLLPQIDVALARGFREVVLTPGNLGYRLAVENGVPEDAVIKVGNFFDSMLESCREKGIDRVLLLGYLGKLLKLSAGIFNTHSKLADARSEILAANAAILGADKEEVEMIMESSSSQEALTSLEPEKRAGVLERIAARASARVEERYGLEAECMLTSMNGKILATSRGARRIGWAEYLL